MKARSPAARRARLGVIRGTGRGHVSAVVDPGDLGGAAGPVRRLLGRVVAAETALDAMAREHAAVADAAIDAFLEYRVVHGYADEDQAAAKALIELGEGIDAAYEVAGAEVALGGRT